MRTKADRIIDLAYSNIASAEMEALHSFTDEAMQQANERLARSQDFLRRAIEAKQAWYATDHDDYEEYPDIAE